MYSEISFDAVLALVKELYETSPDACIRLSIGTGGKKDGGLIIFSHERGRAYEVARAHYINPNLNVLYKDERFRAWCEERGLQPKQSEDWRFSS